MTKKEIATAYAEKQAAVKALQDKGGENLDNLTEAEVATLQKTLDERDACKAQLDKFPAHDAIKSRIDDGNKFINSVRRPGSGDSKTAITKPDGTTPGEGVDVKSHIDAGESEDEKYLCTGPWKGLGHFAWAVHRCGIKAAGFVDDESELGQWNRRVSGISNAIKAMDASVKAASGMSEFTDSDGASFVPITISQQVWERTMADETNLLNLVDSQPVAGNGYKQWAWNDKTRTSGTLYGGARAYWGDEAAQYTASKPTTRPIEWKLNKLYVFMYVTDELMEDSLLLESKLARIAGKCFVWKINEAIVAGTGAGQPLGLLNAPCLVNVSAVSGQGANTIVGANVSTMFARRPPGTNARMVWLYNVDIEPQLDQLAFTAAVSNSYVGQFMYLPPGGLRDSIEPRLKGRPMYETEHCKALGTQGDLILWDPQSYGAIVKSTGIQQAVSMHLRFDYGEQAFRWTFRMDGRPYWDDVLTPSAGATRAPIVTLNSTRT